jgi:hypothetical protein
MKYRILDGLAINLKYFLLEILLFNRNTWHFPIVRCSMIKINMHLLCLVAINLASIKVPKNCKFSLLAYICSPLAACGLDF